MIADRKTRPVLYSKAWKFRLTNPPENQNVIIAETDSTLSGFLCVFGGLNSEWGSFIDDLHVDNIFQGLGVGTGLMLQASTCLQKHFSGCGVYLHV